VILRRFICTGALVAVWACAGCGEAVRYVSDISQDGDKRFGMTYYVGGAGPIGHVGSIDVPMGLQDAGYEGYVELFTWQSLTHAGDQINLSRNRSKAIELADRIRRYKRTYPGQEVWIIALSAGTGIATFALEYLPEDVTIDSAVYLGCSMSSRYDMTRALKRVSRKLYNVYSPHDRILSNVVSYTGTVDRASASEGVAGLVGFRLPRQVAPDTARQYEKLQNVIFRDEFTSAGYGGGHTDSTRREFVRDYLAAALMGDDEKLVGEHRESFLIRDESLTDPTLSAPDASPTTRRGLSRPGSAAHRADRAE